MRNWQVAAIAGCLAAVSLPAAAQRAPQPPESGAYVGGSIGRAEAQDACNPAFLGGAGCDTRDTAWRLLGGYRFNRSFAAELGYHELGKFGRGGGDVRANAWELVGIGSVPVGPLSAYGKLGLYRGEARGFGVKEHNTDLTYGLGAQYDLSRRVALRAEWQRYPNLGGGRFGADTDVDVLSAGALFRFQ